MATTTLYGGDGGDLLAGGTGNDRLYAADDTSLSADILNGGGGNSDWVDYSGAGAGVTVNLTSNISGGAAAGDSYSGIENVQGSRYDDVLFAGTGGRAYGGWGDDFVFDDGTEVLRGGRGADTLSDNFLNSEDGLRDIFFLEAGLGSDTIVGFNSGSGANADRFWLAQDMFDALAITSQGVLSAGRFINNNTNHNANAAHAQIIYETHGNTHTLWYDRDGTGADGAIQIADLGTDGPAALLNADFMVI